MSCGTVPILDQMPPTAYTMRAKRDPLVTRRVLSGTTATLQPCCSASGTPGDASAADRQCDR